MLRRPRLLKLLLPLVSVLAAAPAQASFSVSRHATRGDFEAFNRRFSSDAYFYPRHSAAPEGLLGFEVYADATYDDKFDDQSFNATAVDGDYTGGFLSVALSVRLTGTRTVDATAYELNQYGADVLLSKGFTVLTPYIGAGFVRSKGRLSRGLLPSFEDTKTQGVAFAGVTLNLLLPKINFEVEKGEALQAAVRVGFGF